MSSPCRPLCRGFTLVELLVVIAVIGVLAGLVLSVLPKVRQSAHRATCASHLRQLGVLVMNYAAENKDQLPRSREGGSFSFVSNLLPDMKFGNKKDHPMGKLLYCPADKSGGVATYSITAGYPADNTGVYLRDNTNTVEYVVGRLPIHAFPRPSRTFLLVEAPSAARDYITKGNDSIMTPKGQFDIGGIGIHGGKGANYLYLDGHVAFMNTPLALGQSWPSTKLETYEKWDMGYKAQ
ncbi:type II secretion system protein [Geminisphaera colitermitum]|uniref:type II secretion system protein n=1 Tax=Geminisphaera colitermitum TaxID=1148786 RepID=UPI0018E31962|nr:type II secretion system protein [Geminisphaera colitermitum]